MREILFFQINRLKIFRNFIEVIYYNHKPIQEVKSSVYDRVYIEQIFQQISH